MGKKSNLFTAVKKVLHQDSMEKKAQNGSNSNQWDPILLAEEATAASPRLLPMEGVKLADAENEQGMTGFPVALAGVVDGAQVAAKSAEEAVPLTPVSHHRGKSKEDVAATKIQTAARAYMARGAVRDMNGLERLKTLIQGKAGQKQATAALTCMQTILQLHSQIQARRIRMSEENHSLQRQLHQKHEKKHRESPSSATQSGWSSGAQSKEQMEATQLYRQEAATRREKALAYAHSHQQTWKNASKFAYPTLMDPNNNQWGWSWMERWMAARPWENQIPSTDDDDHVSPMSAASHATSTVSEIKCPHSLRASSHGNKPSDAGKRLGRSFTSLPPSTTPSKIPSLSSAVGKTKAPSQKANGSINSDDSKCKISVQSSKHRRRHSIGHSYAIEDMTRPSSPLLAGPMVRTQEFGRANKSLTPMEFDINGMLEKGSVVTGKNILSISDSSETDSRRHSEPPRRGKKPGEE